MSSPRHATTAGWVGMLMAVACLAARGAEPATIRQRLIPAPRPAAETFPIVWPSRPPADCPFPSSPAVKGIVFTGRHKVYTRADTWYPSWAADGALYSPWTDGRVDKMSSSSGPKRWTTGQAKILGDDPLNLKVIPLGLHHAPAAPYGGRYPCGSLVHNGVWYYGTYCLDKKQYPWDIMGPFVGFRISKDFGKTWTDTPRTPAKPLFGESGKAGAKVKMGAPHVVDFGRNMRHSPDGRMYLTGHGAARPGAVCSWISGDQVYLARVAPSPKAVNDRTQYEFFAGHDQSGRPIWAKNFARIKPLLEWNDHLGCVTVTYNAPLKKYLLCVTDGGASGLGTYDTMILTADRITGPWRLGVFMARFGQQAYFVNIPSKFISADGRTVWLCFADDWVRKHPESPPGTRYGMCLYEARLLGPADTPARASAPARPTNPLLSSANVARQAVATASSHFPQCPPAGAVNGVVGGLPGQFADEWSARGEHAGAWLRLTWAKPRTVNRVWLFDRPSDEVQVTAAELRFSTGPAIAAGALPDDARQGREVAFPARTITWLEVRITRTKSDHPFIGLSELAVFAATPEEN